MNDWSRAIINSSQRVAMPIMTYPGLELTGKSVKEVVTDGQSQFEVMKCLAENFPSAAAVTIMDLSVEAEAFGSPVAFHDDDVPTVTTNIVSDKASIEALEIPSVTKGRCPAYIRAAELGAKHIKDRPTFGGMIGPFSLASRLYDMTQIMMGLIMEPDNIHLLLEKCTRFLIDYAQEFKNKGANGIIIAEPAAGLLSLEHCDEFSSRYVQKIVDSVQDSNFLIILHNCGNTQHLVGSMVSTGAKGFHFGNAVDMAEILPLVPAERLAFGNIDPARTFRKGTTELVAKQTWELLEKTANYKNFVLSSGCDIPPFTPLANVETFFSTLEEFNHKCQKKIG
jgi:uroporphyrinogen decarboxylase